MANKGLIENVYQYDTEDGNCSSKHITFISVFIISILSRVPGISHYSRYGIIPRGRYISQSLFFTFCDCELLNSSTKIHSSEAGLYYALIWSTLSFVVTGTVLLSDDCSMFLQKNLNCKITYICEEVKLIVISSPK